VLQQLVGGFGRSRAKRAYQHQRGHKNTPGKPRRA
jgi:hypothetical protein